MVGGHAPDIERGEGFVGGGRGAVQSGGGEGLVAWLDELEAEREGVVAKGDAEVVRRAVVQLLSRGDDEALPACGT